eukprot:scaffold2343_cov168-Isochrysis_galbana.AAC.2
MARGTKHRCVREKSNGREHTRQAGSVGWKARWAAHNEGSSNGREQQDAQVGEGDVGPNLGKGAGADDLG